MGAVVSHKNSNFGVIGPNIWTWLEQAPVSSVYLWVREFPEC